MSETIEKQTCQETIMANRESLLQLKQFEAIQPVNTEAQNRFYSTMVFCLTRGIPLQTLLGLYQQGTQSNDYYELAVLVAQTLIAQSEEQYRGTGLTEGDAARPGRNGIQGSAELTERKLARIEKLHTAGQAISLSMIKSPPLDQKPDYVVAIEQARLSYPQAWAMLEQAPPETIETQTGPAPAPVIALERAVAARKLKNQLPPE